MQLQRYSDRRSGQRKAHQPRRSMFTTHRRRPSCRKSDSRFVADWPNPDPIGEPGFETLRGRTPSPLAGGPNRYLFLGNNPVNRVDPLGLDFVPILPNFNPLGSLGEVFESLGDFWYAYKDMREANTKGADKYFHCLANCRASRKGPGVPLFVSFGREVVDTITHINHPIDSIKDSMEDMKANKHGWSCPKDESCESRCAKYRPRGLSGKY